MDNPVQKALSHASSSIGFQVLGRLFTFLLNMFVLQHVSSYVLGVMNVRLMLLYTTTQFLSREANRKVCISEAKSHRWESLVNLIWLNIPICLVIGSCLSYLWLYTVELPGDDLISQYRRSVVMMPLAATIELICEPMFIHTQLNGGNSFRNWAEFIQLTIRGLIMASLVYFSPQYSVDIFTLSMFVSSVALTFFYLIVYFFKEKNFRSFFPRFDIAIDGELLKLSLSFFKQGILKQLLTESEKFFMTFFNFIDFAEQGVYEIVNNLASLVPRLLLKPLEESMYNELFSKLNDRDHETSNKLSKESKSALKFMAILVSRIFLIGFIFVIFGFNYSRLLLIIYNRKNLGNQLAENLLRAQCIYLVFIAVNGITEGFTSSAMSKDQLDRNNRRLLAYSVILIVVSVILTKIFGSIGLIFANCINMGLRIHNSLNYTSRYFLAKEGTKLKDYLILFVPPLPFLAADFAIFVLLAISDEFLCCEQLKKSLIHLVFGGIIFIVHAYFIYREIVGDLKSTDKKESSKTKKKK